jgi:hypothetical protein
MKRSMGDILTQANGPMKYRPAKSSSAKSGGQIKYVKKVYQFPAVQVIR